MSEQVESKRKETSSGDSNPCDYCGCEMKYDEETIWNESKWFHSDCLEMKKMIGELNPSDIESEFLVINNVKVIYDSP